MNPEFRQTLNTISRNLETANEAAQENFYTFTQLFIDPCLSGIKSALHDCTAPCFPNREEQLRRKRGRSRGRAELNFDFYDDWDDDENAGNNLLGWGNDELDSLLAGNRNPTNTQPGRQRAMSYGSRGRRKGNSLPVNVEQDPTVIPSSSYLGFLERFPWRFGRRGLRYKPSVANLEDNPGGLRVRDVETEPLRETNESGEPQEPLRHSRQRSSTSASQSTMNSLSSRGDLIMSDEDDDAVPLDDEFAVMLSKRTSNTEDHGSGRNSVSGKPRVSRASTRTLSSRSTKSATRSRRSSSKKAMEPTTTSEVGLPAPASLVDLKREEEQARFEEEMEVEQKREAAKKLALMRGLNSMALKSHGLEVKPDEESDLQEETVIMPLPMREASPEPMDDSEPPKPQLRDFRQTEDGEPP